MTEICFKCGTYTDEKRHPCGDQTHTKYSYKQKNPDTSELEKVEPVDYNPETHNSDGSMKYPTEASGDRGGTA